MLKILWIQRTVDSSRDSTTVDFCPVPTGVRRDSITAVEVQTASGKNLTACSAIFWLRTNRTFFSLILHASYSVIILKNRVNVKL